MKIIDQLQAEILLDKALRRDQSTARHRKMRQERPPTKHTLAVSALCTELGLQQHGFRKAVKAAIDWPADLPDGIEPEPGLVPWEEIEADMSIRPDAFQMVGHEVHCYEVVDSCRLDADRRDTYGYLWLGFDTWGGTIRLWVCDIFGNRAEQDLFAWFTEAVWRNRVQPDE